MSVALDVVAWVFILGGVFFTLTGALGMLRLPDVFTRMHAAGMTDTMGAGMILVGLCFQTDQAPVILRLLLILGFLWFTSPIATHSLAKAALHGDVDPTQVGTPDHEGGGAPSTP